jgi:hypothetical protein
MLPISIRQEWSGASEEQARVGTWFAPPRKPPRGSGKSEFTEIVEEVTLSDAGEFRLHTYATLKKFAQAIQHGMRHLHHAALEAA